MNNSLVPSPIQKLGDYGIKVAFAIFLIFVCLPFILYTQARDGFIRATHTNTVWIAEMNPIIIHHPQGIPFMPLDVEDELQSCTYYKCHSLEEAEKWLISKGYEQRTILTRNYGAPGGFEYKKFLTKGSGELESVVHLVVDFGDGELQQIFFRYSSEDCGFDFSLFKEAPSNQFSWILPWASTTGRTLHKQRDFGLGIVDVLKHNNKVVSNFERNQ